MDPVRTIKYVAQQTGLSVPVIRVWEKRYGAVRPVRAGNNRRLYTEEDVERLRLLKQATAAGHAIGQIATAPLAQLRGLLHEAGAGVGSLQDGAREDDHPRLISQLIALSIQAVRALDGRKFRSCLERGAIELGSPAVLQNFIAPLAEKVGDLWRDGLLTIAHEHFATAALTDFLSSYARPYSENVNAPHLVLATPPGQLHELGAIIVAAAARTHGWRTTYLGASLPIEELLGALQNLEPRAVGLSIVYPPQDKALRRDIERLVEMLPKDCAFLMGGRSAFSYADLAQTHGAIVVADLGHLYRVLDLLQKPN